MVIDELPVVLCDDRRRLTALVAVVRIVPKQRPLGNRATLEQRHDADAVHVLFFRHGDAGEFKQCRIPVDAVDRHSAGRAGLRHARRLDVKRLTYAALPLAPLAASQRRVARRVGVTGGDAAVVGGEADDRVIAQAKHLKFLQHDADSVVHRLNHPTVDRAVLHLAYIQPPIENKTLLGQAAGLGLVPVFLPQLGRGLDRAVHGVKRQVSEERPIVVGLDKRRRLAAEPDRQRLSGRAGLEVRIVPRRKKTAARTADIPAALVDVKAVIGWPRPLAAEMPFPGKERFVAIVAQHLGESNLGGAQVSVVLSGQMAVVAPTSAPRLARRIADPRGDTVLGRIFASENARARRAANLAGRVAACELHPIGGDAVDVRTLVIGGALVAEVTPAKVIGKNENNVGPPLGFVGGMNVRLAKRQANEQDDRLGVEFHHNFEC